MKGGEHMTKKQKKMNKPAHSITQKMALPKHMPKMPKMEMNKTTGAMGVGAVVGAMAGSAVGYAFSDKQRRKMMLEKMQQLKNYVMQTIEEMEAMSEEIVSDDTPQKKQSQNGKSKRHYQTASM